MGLPARVWRLEKNCVDLGVEPGGAVVGEGRGDRLDAVVAGLGAVLAAQGLGHLQVQELVPERLDLVHGGAGAELEVRRSPGPGWR